MGANRTWWTDTKANTGATKWTSNNNNNIDEKWNNLHFSKSTNYSNTNGQKCQQIFEQHGLEVSVCVCMWVKRKPGEGKQWGWVEKLYNKRNKIMLQFFSYLW